MRAARAARAAGAVVAAVRAVVAAARAAEVARAAAVTAAVGSLYICPKVESHLPWGTLVKSHRRNTYSTTDSRKRNPRSCTPRTRCSCTKRGRRTASSRERCRRPCTAVAELRLGTTMAIARTWPSAWPPSTGGKTFEPLSPLNAASYDGHRARATACARGRLHACVRVGGSARVVWRNGGERVGRAARASLHTQVRAMACRGVVATLRAGGVVVGTHRG